MRWLFILFLLVLFTGAVFLFGERVPLQPANIQSPAPRQYMVVYKDGLFSPTNLSLRVNDSVMFENASDSVVAIEELNSGDIVPDAVFSYIFTSSGIFLYHNTYQSSQSGSVTVR